MSEFDVEQEFKDVNKKTSQKIGVAAGVANSLIDARADNALNVLNKKNMQSDMADGLSQFQTEQLAPKVKQKLHTKIDDGEKVTEEQARQEMKEKISKPFAVASVKLDNRVSPYPDSGKSIA